MYFNNYVIIFKGNQKLIIRLYIHPEPTRGGISSPQFQKLVGKNKRDIDAFFCLLTFLRKYLSAFSLKTIVGKIRKKLTTLLFIRIYIFNFVSKSKYLILFDLFVRDNLVYIHILYPMTLQQKVSGHKSTLTMPSAGSC